MGKIVAWIAELLGFDLDSVWISTVPATNSANENPVSSWIQGIPHRRDIGGLGAAFSSSGDPPMVTPVTRDHIEAIPWSIAATDPPGSTLLG